MPTMAPDVIAHPFCTCWPGSAALKFFRRKRCERNLYRIMTNRFGAVSIACSFSLLALIIAFHSSAHAQSADLVLCDRVAADPADPDKPANVQGVNEVAAADVATALKFCKTAAASSRRALYQLGRAYDANRQLPEAISAYRRAADKGS